MPITVTEMRRVSAALLPYQIKASLKAIRARKSRQSLHCQLHHLLFRAKLLSSVQASLLNVLVADPYYPTPLFRTTLSLA